MQKHTRYFIIATCAVSILALSGCGTMNNQTMGKIFGGGIGAAIGNKIGHGRGNVLATVVGGVVGFVIGDNVGSRLDEADRVRAAQIASRRFDDPRPGTYRENWEARDRTSVETVVVTQPMRTEQGRQCREFAQETTIRIDGKPEAATTQGVACYEYSAQNPKGGWVIQK